MRRFVGGRSDRELIFTRNATESINLVAHSYGRHFLRPGDVVLLTHLEHHSNIVPWQILAAEHGRDDPLDPPRRPTASSTSPTSTACWRASSCSASRPSRTSSARCRRCAGWPTPPMRSGAKVVVDACQYLPHHPGDVREWDVDFVAFSAHKMVGPTGIGALWGREELLDAMPPFLGGGSMILNVTLDGFLPTELPHKFEAGTPAIAETVGFGAAVDYLEGARHGPHPCPRAEAHRLRPASG